MRIETDQADYSVIAEEENEATILSGIQDKVVTLENKLCII